MHQYGHAMMGNRFLSISSLISSIKCLHRVAGGETWLGRHALTSISAHPSRSYSHSTPGHSAAPSEGLPSPKRLQKLLVANRGEIACRSVSTVSKLLGQNVAHVQETSSSFREHDWVQDCSTSSHGTSHRSAVAKPGIVSHAF